MNDSCTHMNEHNLSKKVCSPTKHEQSEATFNNYLEVFLSKRYINYSLPVSISRSQLTMYKRLERVDKFFREGCLIKSLGVGAGSGVLGLLFGSFMFGIKPLDIDTTQSWRVQVKDTYSKFIPSVKQTGVGFMKLGFLFSFFDCLVARERAKQDVYTALLAGCLTGASLAWKGGPQSMASGCVGFAAFSAAIEKISPRLFGPSPS